LMSLFTSLNDFTRLAWCPKLSGRIRAIAPLMDHNEVIGNVLRTQTRINPIYVSIGHRISLSTACDWILKLSPKYRLPETTRQADQLVNASLNRLR
ncbi:endonuclease V, partial [Shewanella algae]|uniref:endonuclease V n=1 Tax=Shewanella algae TaxID=38313 RepID=UPI003AAB67F1